MSEETSPDVPSETSPTEEPVAEKRLTRKKSRPSVFSKRLTNRQRLEIISLAKEGIPVKKIAEIHGVMDSTIYRLLKDRGVKIGLYTEKAAEDEKAKNRAELVEKIRKSKDFAYKSVDWIQRQVMMEMIEAQKAKEPVSRRQDNIKTLKIAMETMRLGTDNIWKVLGLDKDNEQADVELPELPVREMSKEEVEAIRDKQTLEDMELGMTPEIEPEEGDEEEDDEDEDPEDEEFIAKWGGGHDGEAR